MIMNLKFSRLPPIVVLTLQRLTGAAQHFACLAGQGRRIRKSAAFLQGDRPLASRGGRQSKDMAHSRGGSQTPLALGFTL